MAQAIVIAAATGYSAYAQNKAGKEQKKLAYRNADILDTQAQDVITQGEQAANMIKRRSRSLKGEQRATFASQGVDLGSGVVDSIEAETDLQSLTDAEEVRANAWREAYGIRTSAGFKREEGNYARRTSRNQAIGTALGGTGSSIGSYYDWEASRVKPKEK